MESDNAGTSNNDPLAASRGCRIAQAERLSALQEALFGVPLMDNGAKIALTLMANSASQRVKWYVDRGRSMHNLSDEELSATMLWAFREFEKASFKPHSK